MAKKLWGGRFEKATDPLVEDFTRSISYDSKLAEYDLIGSIIHVGILVKAEILTPEEGQTLTEGLKSLLDDVKSNKLKTDAKVEDIHTHVQNLLQQKVGDLVFKLHTARSRNDQVVFATKMYTKFQLQSLRKSIDDLDVALLELAKKNKGIIIPGFTHMQHAQPVFLMFYLQAYGSMLERDITRLKYISDNLKVTMGAGALAGTPINAVDYKVPVSEILKELGEFSEKFNVEATLNSLDAVSDRDFIIEVLSALAVVGMHLSRLAEDFIIWSTKEFDFIEIDEAFCTGSSLMPQKKNPDVLELIRGYTGRLYGNLFSVLTMMKGLPLAYNRDMQLDKEPLFDSFEIVSKELKVLTKLVAGIEFNTKKIKEHLEDESLYATDIVYYLVNKKIPFKEAHTVVGKLVKYAADNDIKIKKMTQDQLDKFSKELIKKEIEDLFDPLKSVLGKKSVVKVEEKKSM